MNQGIIIYFLVAVVTHFSIVLGMAILITVGHSFYCFVRKDVSSHATAAVFKKQLKYLLLIVSLSILIGSLSLIVPERAADLSYRISLLIDIVVPLLLFAWTLYKLKAANAEDKPQTT